MVRVGRWILGGAAISLAALGFVLGAAESTGCAVQETSHAQDAGFPGCQKGVHIFCQSVGPEIQGCNTDEGTSPLLSRVPRATRYAVGCVINFVGERDEQGDCRNEGVCKCQIIEPTSVTPLEVDGGAISDAAVPPAPPSEAGPIWNCAEQ